MAAVGVFVSLGGADAEEREDAELVALWREYQRLGAERDVGLDVTLVVFEIPVASQSRIAGQVGTGRDVGSGQATGISNTAGATS